MVAHTHDDKLLVHFFQQSLIGAAYTFLRQYRYNKELVPDRTQLQRMTKKDLETSRNMPRNGERLRIGKIIPFANGNPLAKKISVEKKKGDTNAIMMTKAGIPQQTTTCRPIFLANVPANMTSPYHQPSYQLGYPPANLAGPNFGTPSLPTIVPVDTQVSHFNNAQQRSSPRVFTPIPMDVELLPHLIRQSLVAMIPVKPLTPPYPQKLRPQCKV
ncbi:hypothetical protein CR513_30713, partial [Mucuna pruriens]